MTQKTKPFLKFLNRSSHFEADVEVIDILSGYLKNNFDDAILAQISPQLHPTITKRGSSRKNIRNAADHAKKTIYGSCIKDLYEDMSYYFNEILYIVMLSSNDPGHFVGDSNKKYTSSKILELNSYDEIVALIASDIFRKLEDARNTKNLILELAKRMSIDVSEDTINSAMAYIDVRHKLVHSDGNTDSKFRSDHPQIPIKSSSKKIKINRNLVNNAKTSIHKLVSSFDEEIILKGLCGEEHLAHT